MAYNPDFGVQTLGAAYVVDGNVVVTYTTIANEVQSHFDLTWAMPMQKDLEAAGFEVTCKRVVFDGMYLWRVIGTKPVTPTKVDAKAACEAGKLTGKQICLPDGETVTVERSNGYVMSGWKSGYGWWSIDLRTDKATLIA